MQVNLQSDKTQAPPPWPEKHYTIPQLSRAWGVSRPTLTDWFANEVDVIRFGEDKLRRGRRRTYVSVRIPEPVALRVYRRHTGKTA
jgi:hypothetical protein